MKNEIVLFENQNIKLEVNMKDETVWLSQQQMSELFDTSRTNIIEHINHIYSDSELDKDSTCQDFRQVRKEGIHRGADGGQHRRVPQDALISPVPQSVIDASNGEIE